jgi:hypothetical protein
MPAAVRRLTTFAMGARGAANGHWVQQPLRGCGAGVQDTV